MTFSNVQIFRNTISTLNTQGFKSAPDKIKSGGAFAPNTFESVVLMRSELDNQWENSFIIKYQSLMQNRLNRLKQDLTNAYKALLEVSAAQQVRDNGMTTSNTALTNVYGQLLDGATNGYKQLSYYDDQTAFDLADIAYNKDGTGGAGASVPDGVPSYYQNVNSYHYTSGTATASDGTRPVEMRRLYVTGSALQIVNDMKISMRTEEVPPKKATTPLGSFDFLGSPPFIGGEKVAEYAAEVKAGGFFTTLNYLYNFAPREMKYQYPTAYSTTTEEAGTRKDPNNANEQALLFNNLLTDARDVQDNPLMDSGVTFKPGNRGSGVKPVAGERVKWNSTDPSEGYLTEETPMFPNATASYDVRPIIRRESDNDAQFRDKDYNSSLGSVLMNFDSVVRQTSDFSGFFTPTTPGAQTGEKVIMYGSEEMANGDPDDRIRWEFAHDGVGAADLNQNGSVWTDSGDSHKVMAGFINHYNVATQTVEMNSSGGSWGTVASSYYKSTNSSLPDISIAVYTANPALYPTYFLNDGTGFVRSVGIDGSADYSLSVIDKNTPKEIIQQVDTDGNSDLSGDTDTNEKMLLAGSSKIGKNFDGTFVSRQYQINSFNGQNIATENANVMIDSNTSNPVILAEYEGLGRAKMMSKGVANDYFSEVTPEGRTRDAAERLANKIQSEVNGSTLVDSDFHYSQYNTGSNDSIMFKNIKKVTYSVQGVTSTITLNYNPGLRHLNGTNNLSDPNKEADDTFNNVTVGFRKEFFLKKNDFMYSVYSQPVTSDPANVYVNTPQDKFRTVKVKATTSTLESGTSMDLIVNGNVVSGVAGVYDIGQYLLEGDNVIASQMKFSSSGATAPNHFFKLESDASNSADIATLVKNLISTNRIDNGDSTLSPLNNNPTEGNLSTWQSKLMVQKVEPLLYNTLYPITAESPTIVTIGGVNLNAEGYDAYRQALNSLGGLTTGTKVKDTNTFAKILMEALNKKEYQDIFNLGLINTAQGKSMIIKGQVSAPTGGSIAATIDIRYDSVNRKFTVAQTKFDASGGT